MDDSLIPVKVLVWIQEDATLTYIIRLIYSRRENGLGHVNEYEILPFDSRSLYTPCIYTDILCNIKDVKRFALIALAHRSSDGKAFGCGLKVQHVTVFDYYF
jgi:hypothetical protein